MTAESVSGKGAHVLVSRRSHCDLGLTPQEKKSSLAASQEVDDSWPIRRESHDPSRTEASRSLQNRTISDPGDGRAVNIQSWFDWGLLAGSKAIYRASSRLKQTGWVTIWPGRYLTDGFEVVI